MTNRLTEESLGIYWKGEEVDGIMVYGYWKGKTNTEPSFPVSIWPEGTEFSTFHLYGDDWDAWLWEIPIYHWPQAEEWEDLIRKTLQGLNQSGAKIAWCGIEGHFADPPYLFDPKEMAGGVYAAYAKEFGFKCTAHIGKPFSTLTNDELLKLKALV